jgi:DNA-binding CsgD family transcriptional regulator
MDELPRQKLSELLATYGRSLCDDPRRCEGLLRDVCGAHKREVNVLVSALKERIATDLLSSSARSQPHEILFARLTKRLTENLGLAEDAARWAVDSWALALGTITTQDLGKLRKETSNGRGTETAKKVARTKKKTDDDEVTSTQDRKEELPALTPREREVVSLFAQGYNEQAIATQLGMGEETVRKHLTNAQRKAGVFSRPDLLIWAIAQGFRPPEPPKKIDPTKKSDLQPDLKPPTVEPKKEDVGEQSDHTNSHATGVGSTIWSGLLTLLSIPFLLAGLMIILLGSAIIAMLPIMLVLFALGMDWDQLGETTQGILGILVLALTMGVLGLLSTGWEVLKSKFGYGDSQTP